MFAFLTMFKRSKFARLFVKPLETYMNYKMVVASALLSCSMLSGLVQAKVSEEQAAKLGGEEFTPMGAIVKGNADGTIPAWTGKIRGLPEGLKYSGSGDVYPDPRSEEHTSELQSRPHLVCR